jgi:hypothetical protein
VVKRGFEMPILSRTRNYLFLMTPGTASTAVGEGVLIPKLGGEYFPATHIFDQEGKLTLNKKHASLDLLKRHGLLTIEEIDGLFKFTTVRNPFDRLLTDYIRLRTVLRDALEELPRNPEAVIQRNPELKSTRIVKNVELAVQYPFSEWVDRHFRVRSIRGRLRRPLTPYRRRTLFMRYADGADFVMRFERLQDDFDEAMMRIGVQEPMEIPKINVTRDRERDYRDYYTPKARAIVERVFARDLERFDYSF